MSGKVTPLKADLKQREAERRALRASAAAATDASVASAPSASKALILPELNESSVALRDADAAVQAVEAVSNELFTEMVRNRLGLGKALEAVGVNESTFFMALHHSSAMQQWYRSVKAAQSVMEVEGIADVLREMEQDAGDELIGGSVRTARMTMARTKLEQARWAAQKLLPNLYGEKSVSESHSKVEIVVRRETKKAVKTAVEEEE